MKSTQRGFTIVELLIVIIVIAILAAITITAYSGITKQAENARFLSNIDSYQKSLLLYGASTGDNAVMQYDVNGEPRIVTDTGGGAAPFDWKQTMKGRCIPGNYPAIDGFEEGECLRLEYTWSGGEEEARLAQILIADDFYGNIARMGDASINVPNPTFTKGESSIVEGSLPPEEGGGYVRVAYRTRGVVQHCADASVITGTIVRCGTINLIYLIFGDHTCGRGEKVRTDMEGAMTQLMYGGFIELPEPPESPTVTVCTLAIPQGS